MPPRLLADVACDLAVGARLPERRSALGAASLHNLLRHACGYASASVGADLAATPGVGGGRCGSFLQVAASPVKARRATASALRATGSPAEASTDGGASQPSLDVAGDGQARVVDTSQVTLVSAGPSRTRALRSGADSSRGASRDLAARAATPTPAAQLATGGAAEVVPDAADESSDVIDTAVAPTTQVSGSSEAAAASGVGAQAPADASDGADLVDGLREVQEKLQDARDALNMYKITKADAAQQFDDLLRLPRRRPGGPTWAAALSLQRKVESSKTVPNLEFDTLINEMHNAQTSMLHELQRFEDFRLRRSRRAEDLIRSAVSEAQQMQVKSGMLPMSLLTPFVAQQPLVQAQPRFGPGRCCGSRARSKRCAWML